jgi:hypothetical protein
MYIREEQKKYMDSKGFKVVSKMDITNDFREEHTIKKGRKIIAKLHQDRNGKWCAKIGNLGLGFSRCESGEECVNAFLEYNERSTTELLARTISI